MNINLTRCVFFTCVRCDFEFGGPDSNVSFTMQATVANVALFVNENVEFQVHHEPPGFEPADGELLIETYFSGANPADIKHATLLGIYPAVLGYEFSGKVVKTPRASKFSPGDIVAGYTPTGIKRPAKYGTHQRYLVCPENMAFLVPAAMPQHHAACLTVVAMTAADALYNIFKFPPPQEGGHDKKSGPLLIWGASSGVGLCAVQFAHASGAYPIIVTASPERHSLLLELGATCCFDYKSPDVVSNIKTAAQIYQCGELDRGFDAAGTVGRGSSAEMMAQCLSNNASLVSTVVRDDSRFKTPWSTANRDLVFRINGVHEITISARPNAHWHAWECFIWAVENYGVHFRLPSVEVFAGTAEEALNQIKLLADHGRGFGKLALQHPLRW